MWGWGFVAAQIADMGAEFPMKYLAARLKLEAGIEGVAPAASWNQVQ